MKFSEEELREPLGDRIRRSGGPHVPIELPFGVASALHLHFPGDKPHGWEPGQYPSVYDNDDGFMTCVFPASDILRASKCTPPILITVCDMACVSVKTTEQANMQAAFATALRATVSRWCDSQDCFDLSADDVPKEDKGLTKEACRRIELIANSFTYDKHPPFAQRLLSHIGKTAHTEQDDDPFNPFTWSETFQSTIYTLHLTFPDWEDDVGITPEFARVLITILDQYIQKCYPGFGLDYRMPYSHQNKLTIHQSIGKPTEWSHGLNVPYLKWCEEELRRAIVGLGIKTKTVAVPIEVEESDRTKQSTKEVQKVLGKFVSLGEGDERPDNCQELPDEVIPLVADYAIGEIASVRMRRQQRLEEADSDESKASMPWFDDNNEQSATNVNTERES